MPWLKSFDSINFCTYLIQQLSSSRSCEGEKKKKKKVEECDELRKTGIIHLKSLTKGTNRLEPLQKFGYRENEAERNSGEEQLIGLRIVIFFF